MYLVIHGLFLKNGVEIFNAETKTLVQENKTGINNHFKNTVINFLFEDKDGMLWISAIDKNSQLILSKGARNSDGTYSWKDLSFLRSVIDFSNKNAVTSITKDERTGIVWFCGADGIISYNTRIQNLNEMKSFSVLISNVTLDGDSILFIQNNFTDFKKKNSYLLQPDFYSLRFKFSSLKYDADLSKYQYKLEGINDKWSDWTSEHIKDYTNCSRAVIHFGLEQKILITESVQNPHLTLQYYLHGI